MRWTNKERIKRLLLTLCVVNGLFLSLGLKAQVALENVEFVSIPGGLLEIELDFDGTPPEPGVFEIETPSRLVMDFADVENLLDQSRFTVNSRIADSVTIVDSGNRVRMIVNLAQPTSYVTAVQGSNMVVTVGDSSSVASSSPQAPRDNLPVSNSGDINSVDFNRDEEGSGQIVINLANDNIVGNLNRTGNTLELEFLNSEIDDELQMRLDVTDFATPVRNVDIYREDSSVMVVAEMISNFDYLAYSPAVNTSSMLHPLQARYQRPGVLAVQQVVWRISAES